MAKGNQSESHWHPGQVIGLVVHEHDGFNLHWHMLPGWPGWASRGPAPMNRRVSSGISNIEGAE